MDRLRTAEVFVAVVDEGSIQAAARACDLSPTMVSKHLAALEERLGVRLFNRTTRLQSLTDAGQAYYGLALGSLALVRGGGERHIASVRAAGNPAPSQPGHLRRTRPPSPAGRVPPSLPEGQRDLVLSDRQPSLVEGGFDAAFAIDVREDSDCVARPMPPYPMALGASPAYLARRGVPSHPTELSSHDCLVFSFFDHPDAWRLIGPEGEFRVPVRGPFRANNGQALLQAALAGFGIVHQPELLLAASFASAELVRVLPDYAPPRRPMSLLFLPDRRMTLKLRRFVDFAMAWFAP